MVTGLVPKLGEHGTGFEKPGLLGANGVHLSETGKSICGVRLAKLVKRAKTKVARGGEPQPIPLLPV